MIGVHSRAAAMKSLLKLSIFIKSSSIFFRELRDVIAFSSHCRASSGAESVSSIRFSRDTVPFWDEGNYSAKSRSPVKYPFCAAATLTPGKHPQQQPCTKRQQDQSEKYEFKSTHEEMIDQ